MNLMKINPSGFFFNIVNLFIERRKKSMLNYVTRTHTWEVEKLNIGPMRKKMQLSLFE